MAQIRLRTVGVLAVVAAAAGCASSAVEYVGFNYYIYGPEAALEVLDTYETLPGDRALAEVERGMALLELGRYVESFAALSHAGLLLDERGSRLSTVADRDALPWRPESHEKVLISTMKIADALAIQEMGTAAAAADAAVAAMAEEECASCRFGFTRVLAALAYEGAGRHQGGLIQLEELGVAGRASELVEALRRRIARGVAGDEPAGWAPPPVASQRTLEIILLLGRGPYKDSDKLAVTSAETIRWSRYLPRDPQAVTWAAIDVEDPVVSVELTDVEDLAAASLRHHAEAAVAAGGVGARSKSYDLRHWASLPATLHLLTLRVPDDHAGVDLVYYSPEGSEMDRETIEIPEWWTGSRLFVVRRMP